ncbi:MAG: PfkB family carbohydrate kinase, partial [Gaiellaceae bacterium]
MPALTVVGSINLDLVAKSDRLPRPGETVSDASFTQVPGGKGANQAVAAAKLGADVTLIAAVGGDSFAELALAGLHEADVNLQLVTKDGPTGVALIVVDAHGENTIVVAPGTNVQLRPEDVHLPDDAAVLCQLEIPVAT